MNLTDALTAQYEHQRQGLQGGRSAAERAANALLEGAWQIEPSNARRALHVGMYALRIGRVLGAGQEAGRLWMLGLLSVLAPSAPDDYAVFAELRTDAWSAGILAVARAFEDAVEAFCADASASPAAALRYMLRHGEQYDADAVHALRRALSGAHARPEVKARPNIAAN